MNESAEGESVWIGMAYYEYGRNLPDRASRRAARDGALMALDLVTSFYWPLKRPFAFDLKSGGRLLRAAYPNMRYGPINLAKRWEHARNFFVEQPDGRFSPRRRFFRFTDPSAAGAVESTPNAGV
jgi:hypothetical protein